MANYAPSGPNVESVFGYCKGGYHPVNIGDIFNSRYRVVKKLGYGANSTVWLVEDLIAHCFASLKIIAGDTSSVSSELHVSRYLKSRQERIVHAAHPGREHVVQIFDTFIIHGPNGTHHCIVTEILGISLASDVEDFYLPKNCPGKDPDYFLQAYSSHFPEDVCRRVAAQVALGVAYLHTCGVIHGDLHLGNVLFYSPKLNDASRNELNRIYGPPQLRQVLSHDGTPAPPSPQVPRQLVGLYGSLPLLELCLSSVDDIHVKICDFGEATLIDVPSGDSFSKPFQTHVAAPENSGDGFLKPFKTHMPRILAAPEILFKDISHPATSMDVWALGVLLCMIINHKAPPFDSDGPPCDINNEVIEEMVMQLGKPPDHWWVKWADRAEFFDEEGIHLTYGRNLPVQGLRQIHSRLNFSEVERETFMRLLYNIFRYNPKERITAEEVVRQLPQGWVNPQALEKLQNLSVDELESPSRP